MKDLIYRIIGAVGIDRFAHLGLAGFATAVGSLFGWVGMLSGAVLMSVLGIVKELMDSPSDWWDYLAGELGVALAVGAWAVANFVG